MANINRQIAQELGVREEQIAATVELLDGGATVPFVARYRKEITGGLDDAQLRTLEERLTYLRELEEQPRLHVGIGIATGPVALGVLGSRHRKSITVIGSHVNLAARLQGQAGPGQLVIDRDTYEQLGSYKDSFTDREVTLKGFRTPVGVLQLDLEKLINTQGGIEGFEVPSELA